MKFGAVVLLGTITIANGVVSVKALFGDILYAVELLDHRSDRWCFCRKAWVKDTVCHAVQGSTVARLSAAQRHCETFVRTSRQDASHDGSLGP